MSTPLTTWYLEQTDAGDLRPARPLPPSAGVRIAAADVRAPHAAELGRSLYAAVGGDCAWTDRLPWTIEHWRTHLARPACELWVATVDGATAGYVELDGQDDGVVEIAYFGLLPDFRGRGLGGHLLSHGTARAWDLADRVAGRKATRRVWVHTCSLDGPHALDNYRARGFRVIRTTVSQ